MEENNENVAEIVKHYTEEIENIKKAHIEEIAKIKKDNLETIKAILTGRKETIKEVAETEESEEIDPDKKIVDNIISNYKKKRGI